jgi:hypothetical protein
MLALNPRTIWHYRQYGVRALAAMGRPMDAVRCAGGPGSRQPEIPAGFEDISGAACGDRLRRLDATFVPTVTGYDSRQRSLRETQFSRRFESLIPPIEGGKERERVDLRQSDGLPSCVCVVHPPVARRRTDARRGAGVAGMYIHPYTD